MLLEMFGIWNEKVVVGEKRKGIESNRETPILHLSWNITHSNWRKIKLLFVRSMLYFFIKSAFLKFTRIFLYIKSFIYEVNNKRKNTKIDLFLRLFFPSSLLHHLHSWFFPNFWAYIRWKVINNEGLRIRFLTLTVKSRQVNDWIRDNVDYPCWGSFCFLPFIRRRHTHYEAWW
jgi:hypothetical protein